LVGITNLLHSSKVWRIKRTEEKRKNHQPYELARAKGIAVKRDEGETNRRDVEVDCHCFEKDGGAAGNLRLPLRKILAG
jgi:hypothetical protein